MGCTKKEDSTDPVVGTMTYKKSGDHAKVGESTRMPHVDDESSPVVVEETHCGGSATCDELLMSLFSAHVCAMSDGAEWPQTEIFGRDLVSLGVLPPCIARHETMA